MEEMIRQGAAQGFEDGMKSRSSSAASQNIGGNVETIAVDEENKDLELSIDRLKRDLRISKIMCIVLGVVLVQHCINNGELNC
ncbi:MAG: hypothetical protein K2M91_00770 [Lachnospiraceae bacterium]|nr:hypothetical protein [Lachnospiraceae bacterium]